MNVAQAIDPETLRLHESGIKGAFAAAVRDTLWRPAEALTPWWQRPAASAAERLRLKPGSAKAGIIASIDRTRRALTFPELRAALPHIHPGALKQAIVELKAGGHVVAHGKVKRYRYGLPR